MGAGHASPSAKSASSMPLGTISQRMPNVSSTMRCASADTAVRHREPLEQRLQRRAQRLVPAVAPLAGRVERADRGNGRAHQRRVVGARRERLVEVEHVGAEAADRLERAPGDRATGGDRRDRAVARHAGARPDGRDPRLGRRAVTRGDDARVDAEAPAARGRGRAPAPARRRTPTASTGTTASPASASHPSHA